MEQPAEKNSFPDLGLKIKPEDLADLQQIARDLELEPFEGRKSLGMVKKTREGLEKSLDKLKSWSTKGAGWVAKSKLGQATKEMWEELPKLEDLLPEDKKAKEAAPVNHWLEKIDQTAKETTSWSKATYHLAEAKAREAAKHYLAKGMGLLLYEDTESWILERAPKLLQRTDLTSLADVRRLSRQERQVLIGELYPYSSPIFKKYMGAFDLWVNITLGAVVVSNLPGTGLAASAISMGKSLLRLASRLTTICAIYGYPIKSPEGLFKMSALIIKSLEDWESNPEHQPMDPVELGKYFDYQPGPGDASLNQLLTEIAKKEAYMAIPGVGMISLGKINLDDMKMDLVVEHLVQNYFNLERLNRQLGKPQVQSVLADFRLIYSQFTKADYFKRLRKVAEKEKLLEQEEGKWIKRAQMMAGLDLVLDHLNQDLDRFAREIFTRLQGQAPATKPDLVAQEVLGILGG